VRRKTRRVLVVGAGFAGSVVARQLADHGISVSLIDSRSHIGGNAHDCTDPGGVLIHKYGPHIFHTNSDRIFAYLSQFTKWRPYLHHSRSYLDGRLVPFPVNIETLTALYGDIFDAHSVTNVKVGISRRSAQSSEDAIVSQLGRLPYDSLFAGYIEKFWAIPGTHLDPTIVHRVAPRLNYDWRYFTDKHQAMPLRGYDFLFRNLLDHKRIELSLNTPFSDISQPRRTFSHIVYTGSISEFYENRFGSLPYRSVRLEHIHFPQLHRYQSVPTINYPNDHQYTRVTEFKYLTGQYHSGTSIVREYPTDNGPPSYPLPTKDAQAQYQRYRSPAAQEEQVTFVGRLAEYRYYNMDQVVGSALKPGAALATRLAT